MFSIWYFWLHDRDFDSYSTWQRPPKMFSPLITSLSRHSVSIFFFNIFLSLSLCVCSKCHPLSLRVEWSPFCCPSCVWSWSSIPAGAGVNAAASLNPRRAPAPRRPMRFTTSPRCWWEARPGKVWGTRGVRVPTAAPSASERRPYWMGTIGKFWLLISSILEPSVSDLNHSPCNQRCINI